VTAARVGLAAMTAAALALVPVELGWVPGLRHAWGMTLWLYLPRPVAAALAAGVLLACCSAVRRSIARGVVTLQRRVPAWLALGAVPILLWLVRERRLYGDSAILLLNAASGSAFLFPDVGATFLFHLCAELAPVLDVRVQVIVQAAVAVAGGVAVATFHRAARDLAPSAGRALLLTALTLGAGLTRVLAGHVEVYGFLLAATGVWLWATMAHLRGRVGIWVPATATGLVAWMHLSGVFLLPALVVLAGLGAPGARMRRIARALALAALPMLAFLTVMLLVGRRADVERAVLTMLQWTAIVPSPVGHEAFVRHWGAEEGIGTRYAMFSAAHWRYLANAFFLLTPAAFPLLAAFAVRAPRRFVTSPEARVLSAASLSLLAYTAVVRPVWGPYDWDLFSLTAALVGTLAGHLLLTATSRRTAVELGALAVAVSALMVTVPLLVVGLVDVRAVGPFGIQLSSGPPGETPEEALIRLIGPWL
jgi:hypothetical protein